MGASRILDDDCSAEGKEVIGKMRVVHMVLLGYAAAMLLSGCSLPKIIVLDDPLTAEEHLKLGISYENKGEYEPALKEYKLAAENMSIANLYIGNVYFHMKEYDRAERYYRKALGTENDLRVADACNNLAWLYYLKREKLAEAEFLALKAMEINPAGGSTYMDTLDKIRVLRGYNNKPAKE